MEECKRSFDNLYYDKEEKKFFKKRFRKDKNRWITEECFVIECIKCKNSFYSIYKESRFCSAKCANSGETHPRFNCIVTEETREKIRKGNLGKIRTEESKRKQSESSKGKIFPPELIQKFSVCKKGSLNPNWKGFDGPGYDKYAPRLGNAEEVRRNIQDERVLEIKCTYCGKWHIPKIGQLITRIKCLNGKRAGDARIYCSSKCKNACPIYGQRKYPRGFTGDHNSSREVQPELRKLVLERDDYTCQKCSLSSNTSCVELHCHHIDPVKLNPIESADVDNCITLCKDCHQETHQKDGCKTGQLANC